MAAWCHVSGESPGHPFLRAPAPSIIKLLHCSRFPGNRRSAFIGAAARSGECERHAQRRVTVARPHEWRLHRSPGEGWSPIGSLRSSTCHVLRRDVRSLSPFPARMGRRPIRTYTLQVLCQIVNSLSGAISGLAAHRVRGRVVRRTRHPYLACTVPPSSDVPSRRWFHFPPGFPIVAS